jgi:DnaJ-class molecular chaperone
MSGSGFQSFEDIFSAFRAQSFGHSPIVLHLELSLQELFLGKTVNLRVEGVDTPVSVNILPGMRAGQQFVVKTGAGRRDIIIRISEARHGVFTRRNADLLCSVDISLREALLGFERVIAHVSGESFRVASKQGDVVSPTDLLVLPGLGMPLYENPKLRGRLFVKANIKFPSKISELSEEEIALLNRLLRDEGASTSSSSLSSRFPKKGKVFYLNKSTQESFGKVGDDDDDAARSRYSRFF